MESPLFKTEFKGVNPTINERQEKKVKRKETEGKTKARNPRRNETKSTAELKRKRKLKLTKSVRVCRKQKSKKASPSSSRRVLLLESYFPPFDFPAFFLSFSLALCLAFLAFFLSDSAAIFASSAPPTRKEVVGEEEADVPMVGERLPASLVPLVSLKSVLVVRARSLSVEGSQMCEEDSKWWSWEDEE